MNFGMQHWAALIVDMDVKTVKFYDSMNAEKYGSVLDALA